MRRAIRLLAGDGGEFLRRPEFGRGIPREIFNSTVITMQLLMDSTCLLGAIQYSLAYMLCGGGVLGAIAVYAGAKMLGK